MENISILTTIYNEEDRIVDFLHSFSWSNDIVLVDKSSTDRTVELAKVFNPTIISVPYTDEVMDILNQGLEATKNEWVMMVTASDIIHPKLVKKLLETINLPNFNYDVISMPYSIYVFGIKDKRSPWYNTRENKLARKSVIKFSDRVHEERGTTSERTYSLPDSETEVLAHLTHRNLDIFFEHHIRYCRRETNKYDDESGIDKSWKEIINACKLVFFERKTYKIKDDGMAIALAYVSYFIMKYLFVWQKFRGKGEINYKKLRKEFNSATDQLESGTNMGS